MHTQLTNRLAQLKAELEEKQQNLRTTLLRISGAIQVLEEELGKVEQEAKNMDVH